MYGMVNQAIKDLVESKFSTDHWNQICEDIQIPKDDFVFMQYYPDKLTYDLVGSASKLLNLPGETILKEFGKYWVLYTAKEGYGPMMDLFGSDYKSCLQNLNNLHARMGMTMPQLSPPRFTFVEESKTLYKVSYFSKRPGLCPMVVGLLEGLAQKHNVKVSIELLPDDANAGEKIFKITVLE